MKTVFWKEIEEKVNALKINPGDFDLIAAIERDGLEFGKFLAEKLSLPLKTIVLRAYNEERPPKKMHEPRLLKEIGFEAKGKKILLADKIVKSGATMETAIKILSEKGTVKIVPLAIAGKKNYCLVKTSGCIECK